jgi:DNA-binding response OmpR family regulator
MVLRERFKRFVPSGFLAEASARDHAEGGSIDSLRVHISMLRRALDGTPFAIITRSYVGYGLFNAEDTVIHPPSRASLCSAAREH